MEMMYVEDCCEILDSMRVPITASDREEGKYPYYGANGIQDYVADYIFNDELVLLAEDGGNFGSKERPIAYRVSGKCWVNNHAHVLKPKVGLDVDYLCYSLMFYRVDGMVNGATRQKLTQAAMRKMQIPSRSMEEQAHIVGKLNRVIKIKNQRQQELQLLDKLIQARFVEMFGDLMINNKQWMRLKISEICTEIVDCINKTAPTVEYETEYKMLRTTNVKNGEVDISDVKYVEQKAFDKWTRRSTPQNGDVLLTREAPMGQVGLLHGVKNDVFLGQRLVSYRCDSTKMEPIFLTYQMMSGYFQDQIKKTGKGSTVKHIPVPNCTEFEVFVPPIVKQKEFATFVHQINKLKIANFSNSAAIKPNINSTTHSRKRSISHGN